MPARHDTRSPKTRPLAILVDRSRDVEAARDLIGLEPDDRYHTTDSRVRLNARTLAAYDVLVIAGHGLATYSPREMEAAVQFVRRGGGRLLAGSTGVFERYTGRGVDDMAVCAIALRFGIEFLSPTDASGKPRLDAKLVYGYPRASIRLHPHPAMQGLRDEDVTLARWSPLRCQKRGETILSHRETGEPAAVAARFGKGRVIAVGDASLLCESPRLSRLWLDYLGAGGPRRGHDRRLRYEILPTLKERRSGNVRISYPPAVAARVAIVLRIARKVVPAIRALVGAKESQDCHVELAPSCVSFVEWRDRGATPAIYLAADASDAELPYALSALVLQLLMRHRRALWTLRETVLGDLAGLQHVGLSAMRWTGFHRQADALSAALGRDSRRRFRGQDAGRYYCHAADAPGLWIWRELEERYGGDVLKRLFEAFPDEADWAAAPSAVFTQLDLVIHFLNKATGDDLYPWFAEMGATVHPLPRAKFGTKPFRTGVRAYLRKLAGGANAPASERADAVDALVALQETDKRPLRFAAKRLGSPAAATQLVAAARLAQVRDTRGLASLRSLAKGQDDPAIAGIAAILLVEQRDASAADRLVQLAPELDHRFQLAAGYQLDRLGDARASQFSLDGLRRAHGPKAARMDVRYGREILVFPTVDDCHVANIFSSDGVDHMPGNTHVSRHFVHWVHTAVKFRRRGLARLAMQRTFEDARARRCSCARLGTGTRLTAHALYRSFGFVDLRISEELTHKLEGSPPHTRIKGIKIRAYRPGDETAMAKLLNACYGDFVGAPWKRPTQLPPHASALLAHRGRRLVAYVLTHASAERAAIQELAVASGDKREETTAALMAEAHRRLMRRGVKTVSAYHAAEALAPLLQPLGYSTRRYGGVSMFALLDLPQFLEEITPLLERRLAKSDWVGTIALCGKKHRAGLTIRRGRVSIQARPPARADITLAGSDAAITRIVAGVQTPFEPYLQLDLQITPALNERVLKLLETLFPRVQSYR